MHLQTDLMFRIVRRQKLSFCAVPKHVLLEKSLPLK